MKKSKEPELTERDNQLERSTQDDRYSSWRDGRYESKGMKRWLADFRFNNKHFYWPIVKKYANKAFPWPMQLLLVVVLLLSFLRYLWLSV